MQKGGRRRYVSKHFSCFVFFVLLFDVMVVDESLGDQSDQIGRRRDDDKSLAVFLDEDDVEHHGCYGEHHLDAFVDQEPRELVGVLVHVLLHQVAIEGAQDHLEVGAHNHPLVPPFLFGKETEQDAIQDDADEQENSQVFCQQVLFHSSTQMVRWLSWFSVKPPLMANSRCSPLASVRLTLPASRMATMAAWCSSRVKGPIVLGTVMELASPLNSVSLGDMISTFIRVNFDAGRGTAGRETSSRPVSRVP